MIPYFTGQIDNEQEERHGVWPRRVPAQARSISGSNSEGYDSFEEDRAAHLAVQRMRNSSASLNSFPDINPAQSFYLSKRHITSGNPTPLPPGLPKLTPWRLRDKLKMVNGILLLCLNLDVDPPDVVKTQPCAVLECWVDPHSLPSNKAIEAIGTNLQHQFEALNPRMKYKPLLDPSVDDARKFCMNLRKLAQDERCLFYYNGHGVPKPTASGELWVFNKSYSQYIPVSLWDLQNWLGSPCIYVWDTSSAGHLLTNFTRVADKRDDEIRAQHGGIFPEGVVPYGESLQLAACLADEQLPMCPDLPADLFTSCLTSPIETAMRWFLLKSGNLPTGVTIDMIMQIPGDLKDRRTPLGELNWIFTAVTDTIAWTTFPREIFKKLFRQDLLVAALFRNFLLAERIMKNYHCTPRTSPLLPPTNTHPMWASWDLAVDACLAQLPRLLGTHNAHGHPIPEGDMSLADPYQYIPSNFFSDSLTAFDVWLGRGGCALAKRGHLDPDDIDTTRSPYAEDDPLTIPVTCDASYKHVLVPRKPPDQLPIVLQVLLSQGHRLRALISFAQFCDLGPWAVNLALTIGIFPYILRLLLAPPGDLRPVLIFIWARIVAVDPSVQNDLYSNHVYKYFAQVLSTREEPKFLLIPNASEHRAMCAFILTSIARGMPEGQRALVKEGVLTMCLGKLEENDFLLRQWIVLCIAQIWAENDEIRDLAVGMDAPQLLMGQLDEDQAPDVRAALLYAISTFLGTSGSVDENSRGGCGAGSLPSVSEKGHYRIEAGVSTRAVLAVKEDGSPMVRKELVVLISSVVREWRGHFVVCAWIYWEEDRRARANKVGGKVEDLVSDAIVQWRAGLGTDEEWVETCHQVLSGYFTLFATLLELSIDPYPEVATSARIVVDYIMALLLESPFARLQSSSLFLPPQPAKSSSGYGYSSRSRVTSLQSVPPLTPLTPSSPTRRGVPLSRTDTMTSTASRVTSTLKRTSSFANALKSIGSYAFPTVDDGSPTPSTRQRHPSDRVSRPPSPNYHAQQYVSPYTTGGTASRRSSPPLSPRRSHAPSPEGDFSAVHVMEALMEEDMERLRARREGGSRQRFQANDDRVFTSEPEDARVPLGQGTGMDLPDVLPLKSRFYDWCNEYFTEPQMRQVESHEPGSTTYNEQLWRRGRNEKVAGETQTQAEIAAHCEWNRPVSTLYATGTPLKVSLHAFDSLLVSANEYDKISIWDWTQRKPIGVFSNNNPTSTTITSLRFINDETDGLVVAGSSDGVVRIYRYRDEPSEGSPIQMVSAFRAMPSLVSIKRGPGLVLDWSQAAGAFAIGGDSRDIVIWDASSETRVDTLSTQSNSPLTALIADFAGGPIVVAGFADGAIKAYDRRSRDADSIVRTYRAHSSWIVSARCQKNNGRHLATASIDGEIHLWDSRYATMSVMDWHVHDRLAAFDLHNQTGVFAATSAITSTHWRSHTTVVHSLPPSQPTVLSRVHHATGLHHPPSLNASHNPAAQTSLAFHPTEMLYAVGGADGTIRLLGCRLQERREKDAGGIPRPYELPQPKALFETMSISTAPSNRSII